MNERATLRRVRMVLRAWMCGGSIRTVTCSRVAVRGAQQAQSITDDNDFRHIVELAFADDMQLKRIVYRQSQLSSSAMSDRESESLMVRRNYLRRQHANLHCRPFSWYLANVASAVVRPSSDAEHFGKLRSTTSGVTTERRSFESFAYVSSKFSSKILMPNLKCFIDSLFPFCRLSEKRCEYYYFSHTYQI